jgi:hypothetical protein
MSPIRVAGRPAGAAIQRSFSLFQDQGAGPGRTAASSLLLRLFSFAGGLCSLQPGLRSERMLSAHLLILSPLVESGALLWGAFAAGKHRPSRLQHCAACSVGWWLMAGAGLF